MEFFLQYYQIIIATLVALFGVFKWVKAVDYVNLVKEVGDVAKAFDEGNKDYEWTDAEYIVVGKETVEAIQKGKSLYSKFKK